MQMESTGSRLIGKQLGTCVLEQLIGSGGMGMVYLARQLRPMREVAVKVLNFDGAKEPDTREEFLARFQREANVIAQLDHINILPIYEYDEQEGIPYLVMPYLTGGSLRDLLKRHKTLTLTEAFSYVEQAAAALQYAHDHKVVHRDIKPGNMLFHSDGRLVLVDFGIAHIVHDKGRALDKTLTGAGHFLGSVEYMAPEMVDSQPVDHRADLYELGIVLYQMLTGRVPFDGPTALAIAYKQVHEEAPPPSSLNPELTPAIDLVVLRAIAKRPEERYASAKEFVRSFREAIALSETAVETPTEEKTLGSLSTKLLSRDPHGDITDRQSPSLHSGFTTQELAVHTPPEAHGWQSNQGEKLDGYAVSKTRRGSGWVRILALCCFFLSVLVAGVILVPGLISQMQPSHVSTPTPSPTSVAATPTETIEQKAQEVVQQYYDDINKQDFQAAYLLWSTDYRNANSFQSFEQGFASTARDDVVFGVVKTQSNGTVEVPITLYTTNQSGAIISYQGNYIVGEENRALRLLPSTNLQPVGAEASPTAPPQSTTPAQAQQVVQSYYDALNQHDYQAAYQLWSTDYQQNHPYNQFAAGFATTQSDNLQLGAATPLADGVYRVYVTVTATDKASNGSTTTSTYTGTYIVEVQNGSLVLETANLQPTS